MRAWWLLVILVVPSAAATVVPAGRVTDVAAPADVTWNATPGSYDLLLAGVGGPVKTSDGTTGPGGFFLTERTIDAQGGPVLHVMNGTARLILAELPLVQVYENQTGIASATRELAPGECVAFTLEARPDASRSSTWALQADASGDRVSWTLLDAGLSTVASARASCT